MRALYISKQRLISTRAFNNAVACTFVTTISIPSINQFLDNVDVGDYCVIGELEAYSCMLLDNGVLNNGVLHNKGLPNVMHITHDLLQASSRVWKKHFPSPLMSV